MLLKIRELLFFCICLPLFYGILLFPAYSQQIITDGNTNTSLSIIDTTTNVTTSTIKGSNAYNSFSKFNVDKGNIVNLVVPDKSNNLINLVHSETTKIDGVLNSIKNNRPGGNIFIVNPCGITVGTQGVINVGSLTAVTPTKDFMNKFFNSPGVVNDNAVDNLLKDNVPINHNAEIRVQGKINAIDNVKLDSGSVVNRGEIITNRPLKANDNNELIENIVNISNLENASQIAVKNGNIVIKSSNDIENSGILQADGYSNVDSGDIKLTAKNDIFLQETSIISAKGNNVNSNGGNVFVYADKNSYFRHDSVIDTSGGGISGNGGNIELSAKNIVEITGGTFKASANNGRDGNVLIDPLTIKLGDALSDGVDIDFSAIDSITVLRDVVVSSRNIGTAATEEDVKALNHLTAASKGDSGNISFTAPEITVNPGAKILAFADSGFNSGDITFSAKSEETNAVAVVKIDSTIAKPTILRGNNVNIEAEANDIYEVSADDILTPAGNAEATASIEAGAQIIADNDLTISAKTFADSKLIILTLPILNTFYDFPANAKPISKAYISNNTTVTVGNNISISSTADAKAFVDTIFFTPPANSLPEATAYIGESSNVTATNGSISITATSIANSESWKNAKPGGAFGIVDVLLGAALSKANALPISKAYIDNSAIVKALNNTNGDISITTNCTATASANSIAGSLSTKKTTAGGAVPIANAIPFATSYIGNNTDIDAGHNIDLSSSNTATANSFALYATISTKDDKSAVGAAISVANTTTNTLPGKIITAATGGLLGLPGAIIDILSDPNYPTYNSKSYIDSSSNVTSANNIQISSSSIFSSNAIAIAGAGSGGSGFAGASSYSDSNPVVISNIADSANITATNGKINLNSNAQASSSTNSDAGAIGSGKGIGATVSVSMARPEASSSIGPSVVVNANNATIGDLIISSESDATSDAESYAGAGGGDFAGGASVAYAESTPISKSFIGERSNVTAGHDINIISNDKSESDSLGIFAAISKSTGEGATVAISMNTTDDSKNDGYNSNAYIDFGATISAGNDILIETNPDDPDLEEQEPNAIAHSQAVAGALGGKLGLAGASATSISTPKSNASIKTCAEDSKTNVTTTNGDIKINANNYSQSLASADSGAVGKSAGIGAALSISEDKPISNAAIGQNVVVNSAKNVEINSFAKSIAKYADDITTFNVLAGAGAGEFAGGAAVAVSNAIPKASSYIDSGAVITAGDNVLITSKDYAEAISRGGFAAISGKAGLGGVVTTTNTSPASGDFNSAAYIAPDASVTADDDIEIQTNPDKTKNATAKSHAIAGAGGGYAGLAGAVATANSSSKTKASIESNATVTATTGKITISSNNKSEALASADSAAVGGSAGIGAAVATMNANPVSNSFIASNALVTAGTDIDVTSYADGKSSYADDITTFNALAGTGAGSFAGGASVVISDASPISNAYIDADALVTAIDGHIKLSAQDYAQADAKAGFAALAGTLGIGAVVTTATAEPEANAYVGSGAVINAGSDIVISTNQDDSTNAKANTLAIAGAGGGSVALGAAVATSNANPKSNAYISEDSTVNSNNTGNIQIKARDKSESTANADAVAISIGILGASAAVPIASANADTRAYISGATVKANDGDIIISATGDSSTNTSVIAGAGGQIGLAGSVTKAESNPTVKAYIDQLSNVSTTTSGDVNVITTVIANSDTNAIGVAAGIVGATVTVPLSYSNPDIVNNVSNSTINSAGSVNLNAQITASSDANAIAGAAGLVGLVGAGASANTNPIVNVHIDTGSDITSQDNIILSSILNLNANSDATGASIGYVGAGAAVPVSNSNPTVNTYISGTEVSAINDVSVTSQVTSTVNSYAKAGAAGVVALGGAVSVSTSEPEIKSYVEIGSDADNYTKIKKATNLNVIASNTSTVLADSIGASLGYVAGGASISHAYSNGNIESYIGNSVEIGTDSDLNNKVNSININSISNNDATATSLAAAVGIVSGDGAVSVANANPAIDSYVGESANIITTGSISIKSKAIVDSEANAIGVNVGGFSVGVSLSEANTDPTINTYIAGNTTINAGGNIEIVSIHNYDEGTDNVLSKANKKAAASSIGASGGALIGINATNSNANAHSTIRTYIGSNANIIGKDIAISSSSNNVADDYSSGIGTAIVAIGACRSSADIEIDNQSYIDKNTYISADNIVVNSNSDSDAIATSVAGSGGAIAGAASMSTTNVNNTTKAYILTYDAAEDKRIITSGNIDVLSKSTITYKSNSDSSTASFVGASGARINNEIVSNVESYLGKNLRINAGNNINVNATNIVNKPDNGYDLDSGAGGFAGGPAGEIVSTINLTTLAHADGNDVKDRSKSTALKLHAGNDFKMDAINRIESHNSAKLSSGGAISWAEVDIDDTNTNLANAYVGENAIINVDNDLYVSTRSDSKIYTATNASSWGLAGVSTAEASSTVDNTNLTEIKTDAELYAGRDLNIGAGKDSNGYLNDVVADSQALAWASGGIPVTEVSSSSVVHNRNNIDIYTGSNLLAQQDININSEKGSYRANGYALGTMKTYALFGIPITFTTDGDRESNINDVYSNVLLNGESRSGIGSNKYLYIKRDGSIANIDELISYKQLQFSEALDESEQKARLAGEIADLIELRDLDPGVNADITGKVMLSTRPEQIFNPRNYLIDSKTELQNTLTDPALSAQDKSNINDHIADIDRRLESYNGKTDAQIEILIVPINKANIGTGYFTITGNLSGNGSISAPGNHFSIGVINDSIKNLIFDDLDIASDAGGQIRINGATITSNYGDITVDPGSTAKKRIQINNIFDPMDPRTPIELADKASDLIFNGHIFNTNGDIIIKNYSGNVVTYGEVSADSIDIYVANGDFIHNFTPGIYDTAGNNYEAGTSGYGASPKPTIAAGSIIISAEKININGLVQSGIDEYKLVIKSDFDPAKDLYSEGNTTNLIRLQDTDNTKEDYSNLKAYWDGEKIQAYRANAKGGYIELNGELISTGNGRLRVLDGYGTVKITNYSPYSVVVNKIDLNNRVDGKIVINDKRKYYYIEGDRTLDMGIFGLAWTGGTTTLVSGAILRANNIDSVIFRADPQSVTTNWLLKSFIPVSSIPNTDEEYHYEYNRANNPGIYYPDPYAHITKPGTGTRYWYETVEHNYWHTWLTGDHWYETIAHPYNVAEYKFVAMANKPIPIEFVGRTDGGLVSITSNGNVFIKEDIKNINGNINVTGIAIYNSNDIASMYANNISLTGTVAIGALEQPVKTNLQNGVLTALSLGSINIREIDGDMNIDSINSWWGNVNLSANGSIKNTDPSVASIHGYNVNLTSDNGIISTGLVNAGTITANAAGDIELYETIGNMNVNKIESANGNVKLTADGSILDFNTKQEKVSTQQLSEIWTKMELTGIAGQNRVQAEILKYKQQKKEEYKKLHRIDDTTYDSSYDPDYEYVLTDEEIIAFEHSYWSDEDLNNSKDASVLPQEISNINVPSIVEENNVIGKDITLIANNGTIGAIKPDVRIDKLRFFTDSLTDDEKALLASTDIKKIRIDADQVIVSTSDALNINGSGILTASAPKNIFIESENDMQINTVTSSEDVYLTSLTGSILDANPDEGANVTAKNLYLKSNVENIGSEDDDLDILIVSKTTVSAAKDIYIESVDNKLDLVLLEGALKAGTVITGDIYLTKPNNDLTNSDLISLNSLGGNLILTAENGNIELLYPNINANTLTLNSNTAGITLLYDFESILSVNAVDNIYINKSTGNIILASLKSTSGNVALIADNSILNGTIEAKDINLTATNGLINTSTDSNGKLTLLSEGDINLTELLGDMDINTIKSNSGNATLIADNSILNGTIEAKNINLTATNGLINTSTDSNGKLTLLSEGDINLTELLCDIDINTIKSNTGNVALIADNSILNGTIEAKDINLTATNGLINTSTDSNGKLTLLSEGDIFLTELLGDIDINTIKSNSGNATLIADNSILNGTIEAKDINLTAIKGLINTSTDSNGKLTLLSEGDINLTELLGDMDINTIKSNSGNATLIADNSILNGTIEAKDINLTATNGLINTSTDSNGKLTLLSEGDIFLTELLGDMDINTIKSNTGNATLIADNSILNGTIEAKDINLTATNGLINTSTDSNGKLTLLSEGDIFLTELLGDMDINTIKSNSGNATLIADNSILNGTIEAKDINLTATNGLINTSTDSNGKLTLLSEGDIFLTELLSDMDINTIKSNSGNATLIADNSILNGTIEAKDINLAATKGLINTSTDSNGKLTLLSEGDINLTELLGDMDINTIKSNSGNAMLIADNSILNGTIEAKDINLTATKGLINTSTDSNGKLTLLSEGDIFLTELLGDIDIITIKSNSGNATLIADNSILNGTIEAKDINLTAIKGLINTSTDSNGKLTLLSEGDINLTELLGDIDIITIKSNSGNATLIADNSILNGTIEAKNINLTAIKGLINTSTDSNGKLTLLSEGDIFLTELLGNIDINTVKSNSGNATLIADNSILNGVITANSVDLLAQKGEINLSTDYVQSLKANAEKNIKLIKLSTDLIDSNIISIHSNTENVDINLSNGDINLSRPDIKALKLSLNADSGTVTLIMDFESILSSVSQGDISVFKEVTNLVLDTIKSLTGDVNLTADNSILNGTIEAKNVNLTATNGIINTSTDSNGKLTLLSEGDINLTELLGDMDINTIKSNTGNATLIADNSILNGTIEAKNVNLTATNGEIFTTMNSNGILNALANQTINIQELDGDINLDRATSSNADVILRLSNGSINDINGLTLNIAGHNVVINAKDITDTLDFDVLDSTKLILTGNASLSGNTGNLDANINNSLESVKLTANNSKLTIGGDAILNETKFEDDLEAKINGQLTADKLTIVNANIDIQGDVNITNTKSTGNFFATIIGILTSDKFTGNNFNINIKGIMDVKNTVLAGDLTVDSADNILINTLKVNNILATTAKDFDLKAGDVLGKLTLMATGLAMIDSEIDGSIFIDAKELQLTGYTNLFIDKIITSDANLTSLDGDIADANNSENINIYASNLNLLSSHNIGNMNNYLDIKLEGKLNAEANENIFIKEHNSDLIGEIINSRTASVYLESKDGKAIINYVSAPDVVKVKALSDIFIDTIEPKTVILESGSGANIVVNNGLASDYVFIQSDNISATFQDTDTTNPLTFSLTGSNGANASNVNLNASSDNGIVISNLLSNDASVNNCVNNTVLTLNNTNVINQLNIQSDHLNATNNIIINKLGVVASNGGFANDVNLIVNGNLTVNNLRTNYAEIAVTGNLLNVYNAMINDIGSLSNNNYRVLLDNTMRADKSGSDMIIYAPDRIFILQLNETTKINTDADVVAASDKIQIIGDAKRPDVNNDFCHVNNTALSLRNKKYDQSELFLLILIKDFIGIDDPNVYLDKNFELYTLNLLDQAIKIYYSALNDNESEEIAVKKAVALLKQSKFNPDIAKQLMTREIFNENSNYVKLLQYLISIQTM